MTNEQVAEHMASKLKETWQAEVGRIHALNFQVLPPRSNHLRLPVPGREPGPEYIFDRKQVKNIVLAKLRKEL